VGREICGQDKIQDRPLRVPLKPKNGLNGAPNFCLRDKNKSHQTLLDGWGHDDITISHATYFAGLQIDGPGQAFMAVKSASRNTWDFFVVDDCYAVLHYRDVTTDERDVEGLPHICFARLLGDWIEEAVYATGMVAVGLGL
jgi:hypothetical protein